VCVETTADDKPAAGEKEKEASGHIPSKIRLKEKKEG